MSDQAAYTDRPGQYRCYPSYVNIKREGGFVRITVREPEIYSEEKGNYLAGDTRSMVLSIEDYREFLEQAARVT